MLQKQNIFKNNSLENEWYKKQRSHSCSPCASWCHCSAWKDGRVSAQSAWERHPACFSLAKTAHCYSAVGGTALPRRLKGKDLIFSGAYYKWLWLTGMSSVWWWVSALWAHVALWLPVSQLSLPRLLPSPSKTWPRFPRNMFWKEPTREEVRRSSTGWLRCFLMHQGILIMLTTRVVKKVSKRIENKKQGISTHARVHCWNDLICHWNKV